MLHKLIALSFVLGVASTASAQDWAKAKLNNSPRHQEWVTVKHGDRSVQCFVVYPEVMDKAPVVLLIHEIYGLSDWARDEADQVAAVGYIAIAPDLVSGLAPGGGGTSEFPDRDAVVKAVSKLPPEQVTADLNAAADYALRLPASNGELFVAGFCWGGGKSFRFATSRSNLKAAFVFYGTAPTEFDAIAEILCPVYGFYGGNDARVSETVPATIEIMKKAGKTFEPVIYEEAGHGFMRAGEDPTGTPANKRACRRAWERWVTLLKKNS
jgi:carboxymethylenebutenolidase